MGGLTHRWVPLGLGYGVALAAWLLIASGTSGCIVRVYQPMSGLQAPVVVDPTVRNFEDVRMTVHCVPGAFLSRQENSALCRKVGALFEIQGAQVRTIDTIGRAEDELEGEPPDGPAAPASEPPTDLTLELRARELHEAKNPMSWLISIGTFTLLPGVSESTFAQDVVIRDSSGFLLVSDSLEGRVMLRFGLGSWLGTAVSDLGREKDERLIGRAADQDLSEDLYGQLSQLAFNAKVQWQILRESAPQDTVEVP